jgi:alkylation response protein AidB-like acyl-CoA dehydrogenase
MLTLLPTPEQQQIADAVRDLLSSEWPIERLRQPRARQDSDRWPTLAALGAIGIGLETAHGGLGLSAVEEALVFREFGRYLLPPRILATVLGARVAAAAGCADLCADLLEGRVVVGLLNAIGAHSLGPHVTGRFLVVDGVDCDLLLAWGPGGAALVTREAVRPTAPRASVDDVVLIESCELADVPARIWLGAADEPVGLRADVLLAAMLVGVAEASRDMAAAYARLRQAFGQPIGAFQAIKHRCAEAAVRCEAAWCQTAVAAVGLRDSSDEVLLDVAAARWIATQAAQGNAESNVQVHGGIGFSDEADPHRHVKRAILLAQIGLFGRMLRSDLLSSCNPATVSLRRQR